MKKTKKVIVCLIILICVINTYFCSAYADFTTVGAAEIGAASMGMADAFGIGFIFDGMDASSVAEWIETEIDTYSGGDPGSKFITGAITAQAGKLIIPAIVVSQINDFLLDIVDRYSLNKASQTNISLTYGGLPIVSYHGQTAKSPDGLGGGVPLNIGAANADANGWYVSGNNTQGYALYNTNVSHYVGTSRGTYPPFNLYALLLYDNGNLGWGVTEKAGKNSSDYRWTGASWLDTSGLTFSRHNVKGQLSNDYDGPWEVQTGGSLTLTSTDWTTETSISDMVSDVFTQYADGELDFSAEIIGPAPEPTPAPTPVPSFPPAETELEALNTSIEQLNAQLQQNQDIIGGISSALEGINDLLENQGSSLESIDDLKQILSDVQNQLDGLNDLITNSDSIVEWLDIASDTIDQIVNDQLQPILDQIILGNGTIETAINSVDESIGDASEGIDSAVEELGNVVNGLSDLNDLLDDLKRVVTNIYTGQGMQTDAIESAASNVSGSVDSAASSVSSSVNSAASSVSSSVDSAASSVSSSVNSAASSVTSSVNSAASNVTSSVNSAASNVTSSINTATDSITQSVEGVTDAVGSLEGTLSNALAVPDNPSVFKFDLRELFPFSIPFDIYRLLSSFDAQPEAPHVRLPLVIDSINFSYTLDLDFSAWDPVAQAMRTAELIVYAIGLAWATGKVIKW